MKIARSVWRKLTLSFNSGCNSKTRFSMCCSFFSINPTMRKTSQFWDSVSRPDSITFRWCLFPSTMQYCLFGTAAKPSQHSQVFSPISSLASSFLESALRLSWWCFTSSSLSLFWSFWISFMWVTLFLKRSSSLHGRWNFWPKWSRFVSRYFFCRLWKLCYQWYRAKNQKICKGLRWWRVFLT